MVCLRHGVKTYSMGCMELEHYLFYGLQNTQEVQTTQQFAYQKLVEVSHTRSR